MERDLNTPRWYRHRVTGLVGQYPPRLGENDPNLTEVPAGAKRLAFPLPRPLAVEVPATPEVESGEGELLDDSEEE